MKSVARVRWLSKFDMEPLLGWVLIVGMMLSVGLMVAGVLMGKLLGVEQDYWIHAASIPRLIRADLYLSNSPDFWPRLLIDLGFAVFLITPYARLVVTWLYFVFVKHRWKYAIYTSGVLILLGMVLFSDIVLAP